MALGDSFLALVYFSHFLNDKLQRELSGNNIVYSYVVFIPYIITVLLSVYSFLQIPEETFAWITSSEP
jgi:heme/copper-type cytochrome/quinol oxidase subunit 2